MASPYSSLPAFARWDRAIVEAGDTVDPIVSPKFTVDRTTRIATCGSCFAQHLGRHLIAGQHTFLVTEAAPALLDEQEAREYQYGIFTARFGNVYTSRALRQLVERALGLWTSAEPVWTKRSGRIADPLRPHVHAGGFASIGEMLFDRHYHEGCVRGMLEQMDLFAFTLGLTEMWECVRDETALPVCPGGEVGTFDAALYRFRNLSLGEIIGDLERVIELIKQHNPRAKVLLTVSPVPLVATCSGSHVLTATTYSKSLLRVAAEIVKTNHSHVDYLPAFEIITGTHTRGRYYANDLRSIREEGVQRVMQCFFNAYSRDGVSPKEPSHAGARANQMEKRDEEAEDVVDVICDEDLLMAAYESAS